MDEGRRQWGRGFGSSTVAFDEWHLVDSDLRAYLDLTTRWMNERFNQTWDEVGRQPAHDDSPEQIDVFHQAVGGLLPGDFDWMLQASVIRDAVSAYEVYLEKAGEELAHGAWRVQPGKSPRWPDIVSFYDARLGVNLASDRIAHIRELRHSLTHLRGELRTSAQREAFGRATDHGFVDTRAELGVDPVTDILNDLAISVRQIDSLAWNANRRPTQ
jgi:hypothetical protein